MTGTDNENNTTTEGPLSESTSQMAKKCLDIIEEFRRGSCTALDRADVIGKIAGILTSAMPELPEPEVNDALGSYLSIVEQHVQNLDSERDRGLNRIESDDEPGTGDKRGGSPETGLCAGKKSKIDDGEFPWVVRENLTGVGLSDDLQKTLESLRTYAKDLKYTKSSILTSPHAPQFPNSEWANVIIGAMVDLDHVLSGAFAVSNDNRDVEVVGGIQFKFGTARAAKQVRTSGDWFIAWNMYSKAVAFAFPHRQSELQCYGQSILGLFSATLVGHHSNILFFDKAVRVRVGERRDLLLTDFTAFEDLRIFWLNPIGAGDPRQGKEKGKPAGRSDSRSEDPCDRWNRGVCRTNASECKYRHVCQKCGGNHKAGECEGSKE